MTITAEHTRAEPDTATRDLRGLWRIALAIALPVGPLLVTVVRAIMPYWTSDDSPTIVGKIAAAPEVMSSLVWLGVFLTPAIIISMLTLGYVARRGAPVLAGVGTVLSFAAYAMWGTTGSSDYTAFVLTGAGYGNDEVTAILGHLENTAVAGVTIGIWILGHILGLVLLAIALHRARVLPLWAAMLMALSQPIHLLSAAIIPMRWLDVVGGWGMTTFTCLLVSLYLWRMRNDEFDLSPTR